MPERPLIVASNRGPVTFSAGAQRRGVGGLVTAVGGAMRGRSGSWIAAPMTDEDRDQPPGLEIALGGKPVRIRFAEIEPDIYDAYYNQFSNRILWFLHHYLWETPREPVLSEGDDDAWQAYRLANHAFADAILAEAPPEAVTLPQDYHLSLTPALLRERRADLSIAMFWHIPFCQADQFRVLPDSWATALLEGMLGADIVGFQSERWADNFVACCRAVLGARTRGRLISYGGRLIRAGIYPVGVNGEHLREEAARPEVEEAYKEIDAVAGDRALVLRVDRTELSKNILRGLAAFEQLLERRNDLHGRVTHLALLTPSRRDVPEYAEYIEACLARAERINERFSHTGWIPVDLRIEDNFPRTLAAYRRYDVLIVNPVFDGMNLVAREGPQINERDGVLVLSRNAGAAVELGSAALVVNPFDVAGTSVAIERALDMDAVERKERAAALRPLARGMRPERWLDRQISDLSRRVVS